MLPDAYACVDVREKDDYAKVVRPDRLWIHPPTETIGAVKDWMVLNNDAESMLVVDDDFVGIYPLMGMSRKYLTTPEQVMAVAWNGYRIARDLDLSAFAWCPFHNPARVSPMDPFHVASSLLSPVLIRGTRLRFDPKLNHGEDMDFTLQSLLKDRVALCDWRFWWDCGLFAGGSGGMQETRTGEGIKRDIEILKMRWGQHLVLDQSAKKFGRPQGVACIRLNVRRKANVALK